MAIVITGAAGFIGMHVTLALLARGDSVVGIGNLNDYYPVSLKRDRLSAIAAAAGGERFRFRELDFADATALDAVLTDSAIDRIVHLGAQAGVRYSLENPRAYVASNLAGHVNMLELARERGVAHLVYASSSSVYGASKTIPFRVADRVDWPISLYAATKRADELMSETYSHLFRIPQTGLRFFTVCGPWGRPDMAMWLFTDAILADRPIKVFNHGKMQRDFTYYQRHRRWRRHRTRQPAPPPDDGAAKAGGSVSPHRLYNIGNNRPEELETLISVLADALGKTAVRVSADAAGRRAGDLCRHHCDQWRPSFRADHADHGGHSTRAKWYREYSGR